MSDPLTIVTEYLLAQCLGHEDCPLPHEALDDLTTDMDSATIANLRHDAMERDVDRNAFLRFCIDELGMPEPMAFTYRDGFTFIKGRIEAAVCPTCSLICVDCGCRKDEHMVYDAVLECDACGDRPCSGEFTRADKETKE